MNKRDLEPRAVENLIRLSAYLKALPPVAEDVTGFDMDSFYDSDAIVKEVNYCATSACAVGHFAIMQGWQVRSNGAKPKNPTPEYMELFDGVDGWMTWATFCRREVGVSCKDGDRFSPIFDWMFGSEWVDADNTANGAAARIDYFLEYGVPDLFIEYGLGVGHDENILDLYSKQIQAITGSQRV